MDTSIKNLLIESVKTSKSPKSSLDGVKFLLGNTDEYKEIFRICFDDAWKDTRKRNRVIEKSQGRLHRSMWPNRKGLDDPDIKVILGKFQVENPQPGPLGDLLANLNESSIVSLLSGLVTFPR